MVGGFGVLWFVLHFVFSLHEGQLEWVERLRGAKRMG